MAIRFSVSQMHQLPHHKLQNCMSFVKMGDYVLYVWFLNIIYYIFSHSFFYISVLATLTRTGWAH